MPKSPSARPSRSESEVPEVNKIIQLLDWVEKYQKLLTADEIIQIAIILDSLKKTVDHALKPYATVLLRRCKKFWTPEKVEERGKEHKFEKRRKLRAGEIVGLIESVCQSAKDFKLPEDSEKRTEILQTIRSHIIQCFEGIDDHEEMAKSESEMDVTSGDMDPIETNESTKKKKKKKTTKAKLSKRSLRAKAPKKSTKKKTGETRETNEQGKKGAKKKGKRFFGLFGGNNDDSKQEKGAKKPPEPTPKKSEKRRKPVKASGKKKK